MPSREAVVQYHPILSGLPLSEGAVDFLTECHEPLEFRRRVCVHQAIVDFVAIAMDQHVPEPGCLLHPYAFARERMPRSPRT